jgi:hypothetical protein
MKTDITELLLFFDELMPMTDEERGVYWLKTLRPDGLIVIFAFSIYEAYVHIIIHNESKIDIASVTMENCSEVRILDAKRKCLEVVHDNGNGRCFVSLIASPILAYTE